MRALLIKEETLQKRRNKAEDQLQWHKRPKEEPIILELEQAANSTPINIPDSPKILTGAELNKFWETIKFDDRKKFTMSQKNLEQFLMDARKIFKEVSEEQPKRKSSYTDYVSDFEIASSIKTLDNVIDSVSTSVLTQNGSNSDSESDVSRISVRNFENIKTDSETIQTAEHSDINSIQNDDQYLLKSALDVPSNETNKSLFELNKSISENLMKIIHSEIGRVSETKDVTSEIISDIHESSNDIKSNIIEDISDKSDIVSGIHSIGNDKTIHTQKSYSEDFPTISEISEKISTNQNEINGDHSDKISSANISDENLIEAEISPKSSVSDTKEVSTNSELNLHTKFSSEIISDEKSMKSQKSEMSHKSANIQEMSTNSQLQSNTKLSAEKISDDNSIKSQITPKSSESDIKELSSNSHLNTDVNSDVKTLKSQIEEISPKPSDSDIKELLTNSQIKSHTFSSKNILDEKSLKSQIEEISLKSSDSDIKGLSTNSQVNTYTKFSSENIPDEKSLKSQIEEISPKSSEILTQLKSHKKSMKSKVSEIPLKLSASDIKDITTNNSHENSSDEKLTVSEISPKSPFGIKEISNELKSHIELSEKTKIPSEIKSSISDIKEISKSSDQSIITENIINKSSEKSDSNILPTLQSDNQLKSEITSDFESEINKLTLNSESFDDKDSVIIENIVQESLKILDSSVDTNECDNHQMKSRNSSIIDLNIDELDKDNQSMIEKESKSSEVLNNISNSFIELNKINNLQSLESQLSIIDNNSSVKINTSSKNGELISDLENTNVTTNKTESDFSEDDTENNSQIEFSVKNIEVKISDPISLQISVNINKSSSNETSEHSESDQPSEILSNDNFIHGNEEKSADEENDAKMILSSNNNKEISVQSENIIMSMADIVSESKSLDSSKRELELENNEFSNSDNSEIKQELENIGKEIVDENKTDNLIENEGSERGEKEDHTFSKMSGKGSDETEDQLEKLSSLSQADLSSLKSLQKSTENIPNEEYPSPKTQEDSYNSEFEIDLESNRTNSEEFPPNLDLNLGDLISNSSTSLSSGAEHIDTVKNTPESLSTRKERSSDRKNINLDEFNQRSSPKRSTNSQSSPKSKNSSNDELNLSASPECISISNKAELRQSASPESKSLSNREEINQSESLESRSMDLNLTGVSHIDVRKRVNEILDSSTSRGDKSPRMQDLYVTTYDVMTPSPGNSPEISSSDEIDFKERKNILTRKLFYGEEAEALLRKQLEIEQEIKRLEQQQKESAPYCFMREIPNKPPPPYKPPPISLLPTVTTIIPTDPRQVQTYVQKAAAILYEDYEQGKLSEKSHPNIGDRMNSYRFIFDLCKEIALDLQEKIKVDDTGPSWMQLKPRLQPLEINRKMTKEGLESMMNRKVQQLLGFQTVNRKDNLIVRWSRKKRDHVDEILVLEAQTEEAEWTNYDKDELTVKTILTNEILDMLISETALLFSDILKQKK